MIPKIIHYCWFGGALLPTDAQKCIESWKKYCPDYEIKEWNESNFDITICPYVKEAYEAKKWAFVSDYARFWILYNFGGIYFDTDVELIKPINDIIEKGPFMGFEKNPSVSEDGEIAPGLGIAAPPELELYKDVMNYYESIHFKNEDGSLNTNDTIVTHTTKVMIKKGLKKKQGIQFIAGILIYPKEYFCPLDYLTYEMNITENTRSIHHYTASWQDKKMFNIKNTIKKSLPTSIIKFIMKVKSSIRNAGNKN